MRTKMEQEGAADDRMRAIAKEIRDLAARARQNDATTLAYLLDMAAIEAEAAARQDARRSD